MILNAYCLQYVFSFMYDEQGGVTMEMGTAGNGKRFAFKPSQQTVRVLLPSNRALWSLPFSNEVTAKNHHASNYFFAVSKAGCEHGEVPSYSPNAHAGGHMPNFGKSSR